MIIGRPISRQMPTFVSNFLRRENYDGNNDSARRATSQMVAKLDAAPGGARVGHELWRGKGRLADLSCARLSRDSLSCHFCPVAASLAQGRRAEGAPGI